MPVIRDIPLRLQTGEILRRQGLWTGAKVRPEIMDLILELLGSVKKADLLEPAVAYEIHTITEISQRRLSLDDKLVLRESSLPSLLPQAKDLAVAVCTVGPRLEKQVTDYTSRGEPLRGVLLDGIGSAAVDSLMEEVCKLIRAEASSRGYELSSPISPGMPGLPIAEQWQLLELAPTQEIGVSLTSAGMMVPRKSISMLIGIGPQMATWTRAKVCARCSLRETCDHKVTR